MKLSLTYEIKVIRKDGRVRKRVKGKSHSLLRNFIALVGGFLSPGFGTYSIVDSTGATRTHGTTAQYQGNVVDRVINLVVGGGDTAVTPDDYELANGLYAAAADVGGTVTVDGDDSYVKWGTAWILDAGNDATIKEIGMNTSVYWNNTARAVYFCRDVLATPISVPAGEAFSLTYTLKVTV